MSQEYEYEAGRSRARQSRRRPSMGNMENGRPAESAVQGRLAAEEGTGNRPWTGRLPGFG